MRQGEGAFVQLQKWLLTTQQISPVCSSNKLRDRTLQFINDQSRKCIYISAREPCHRPVPIARVCGAIIGPAGY